MTPSILIPLVVIIAVLAVVDEGELKLDASNVVVHSNPSDGYQVFEWSDGYYAFTTKFVYQENGEEDTEIQDFPADGFEGDNDYTDATTGIGTIHTIDSDGTHRYYDMQGRQLRQRPARGLYIENGKIQFNK